MHLLHQLCTIHAPSGSEYAMKDFLLRYIEKEKKNWKVKPRILKGNPFQDCLILIFGKPRTAIFAHMDSIGFTVRYKNGLVKIGAPQLKTGYRLVGTDSKGGIEGSLVIKRDELKLRFRREAERGTTLTFKPDFRETADTVQCCYLDNRLGVWNALKVAETLKNGAIVFSCWEEHGGGTAGYLAGYLYEKYKVRQALISDITWITQGVRPGKGAAISMRDVGIPRRSFLNKITGIVSRSGIPYQLEVEGSGGSDGTEIQKSPFPVDWCFIGAAEENVHSPDEKVHKKDMASMTDLYRLLMEEL